MTVPVERFTPEQKIAMAVLLTANFTLAVDFSILNVALPHIGTELGFATSALQWIVTSFALCAAGFTLFFGRVADLFGRKRLFLIGIVLLGVSSLAGGIATEPILLIVTRVGQGIATAMVTPAALSLMTTMFPEGPARSRALGLNGALMAAGFTAGAVLGGLLTGAVSWRWAFFINVVVALAVIVIAPFVLREPARGSRPKLDVPGAVTITLALVALVFGIDTAGHNGWTHPGASGPILAALILFAVFLKIEGRVKEPLVAPSLLKRRNIGWGSLAGLLAFATETSLVFLLTLYLQQVLGYSAITAGLILTFVGGIANLVAIVGYVVASTSGVPSNQQGLATGLVTMSQQVGIALGTPVMSAIATGMVAATLLPGLQLAIGVNAAIAIGAAILLGVFLRLPKAPAPLDMPAADPKPAGVA
jgi:EmrB/QacA subfamily drug resistance transporter